MTTPQEVMDEARSWLNTPWLHQGRLKGVGVDCAGLIVGVGSALGLTSFDTTAYGRVPDGVRLKSLCDAYLVPVKRAEMAPGMVVLCRFTILPQHLAIVGDSGAPLSLIHAYGRARKCVEHGMDDVWADRILNVYRFPGVE